MARLHWNLRQPSSIILFLLMATAVTEKECGRLDPFHRSGARVPFPLIYIAFCIMLMTAVWLFGAPTFSVLVLLAATLVAVLGVPHGGLDHWTGRRLLASHFRERWWLMFFPGYLAVGLAVAAAWLAFPVLTVLGFFFLSAWHFGREDQHRTASIQEDRRSSAFVEHVSAIALGGLVIWIPAITRPLEMEGLLRMIVPSNDSQDAAQIVRWTHWGAMVLCPMAILFSVRQLLSDRADRTGSKGNNGAIDWSVWVPLATAGIAAFTPILVSFTAYFCFWHSMLGLSRLQSQEGLTRPQFMMAVLPLSALAVGGVAALGFLVRFADGRPAIPASLQTLFIGLSAIAVPHLLLHEWFDLAQRKHPMAELTS